MRVQIKDKVIISDPCYTRGTWCMTEQDNMLEGEYNCYVEQSDEKDWGIRIKSIEIVHSDYERPQEWIFKNDNVGVDSGQAGIFCDSIYPEEDTGEYGDLNSFYGKCCELTSQNGEEVDNYHRLIRDIKQTKRLKESGKDHGVINYDMCVWNRDYHKEYADACESLETYLACEKKQYEKSLLIRRKENDNEKWEEYTKTLIKQYEWYVATQYHHKLYKLYNDYLTTNTLPEEPKLIQFGIIDNKGIVSRSGFGDESYNCYVNFNDEGKCIGVKVIFIQD